LIRAGPQLHIRIKDDYFYESGTNCAGFVTIDINAGPGEIEWIVINDGNYELLKKVTGIDPLKKDTFWKYDLDLLISSKISFRILNQKVGDIISIGSGCFIWSRPKGLSTHISYKIVPQNHRNIIKSILRVYEKSQFTQKYLQIPINGFLISILNEGILLENEDMNFLLTYIEKQYIKDCEQLLQINYKNTLLVLDKPRDFCESCGNEMFNYWTKYIKGIGSTPKIYCLDCSNKSSLLEGKFEIFKVVNECNIEALLSNAKIKKNENKILETRTHVFFL